MTPKPGYKTTEFWLALAASVVSFVLASGMAPEAGPIAQVIGFVGGVLSSLGYSVSRGLAKKSG